MHETWSHTRDKLDALIQQAEQTGKAWCLDATLTIVSIDEPDRAHFIKLRGFPPPDTNTNNPE